MFEQKVRLFVFDMIEKPLPKSHNGGTPLHYAARFGHLDTCRVLIQGGVLKNPKNNDAKTPFDLAIEAKREFEQVQDAQVWYTTRQEDFVINLEKVIEFFQNLTEKSPKDNSNQKKYKKHLKRVQFLKKMRLKKISTNSKLKDLKAFKASKIIKKYRAWKSSKKHSNP